MYKSSFIKNIQPEIKNTWSNNIFITFDIDWAHDEIINDTYELIKKKNRNLKTTWFSTHKSKQILKISKDPNIEIGIHPNYNGLFNKDFSNGSSSYEVIKRCLKLNPKCSSIRSHSLTNSERLLDQLKENGLSHICNNFIPYSSKIVIKPYKIWDNLIIVPHCWQDNVSLRMQNGIPLGSNNKESNLLVYDFHPIHVFLNTESLERYEKTRLLHNKPNELIKHRYNGYGIRNQLIDLIKMIEK